MKINNDLIITIDFHNMLLFISHIIGMSNINTVNIFAFSFNYRGFSRILIIGNSNFINLITFFIIYTLALIFKVIGIFTIYNFLIIMFLVVFINYLPILIGCFNIIINFLDDILNLICTLLSRIYRYRLLITRTNNYLIASLFLIGIVINSLVYSCIIVFNLFSNVYWILYVS